MLKYPVFFATNLEVLSLDEMYQPVSDSFIFALISWNSFDKLKVFNLVNATHLSIQAAKSLIEVSISESEL